MSKREEPRGRTTRLVARHSFSGESDSTEPKARVLLVTAPLSKAQALSLIASRARLAGGVTVEAIGTLPDRARVDSAEQAPKNPALSRRQVEVLREIVLGTRGAQIARMLNLSRKTVDTHRLLIINKLGIRDVPGLVRYALRTGILPLSWLAK
ncbi:MAG TPA: LuxR C-terminal-related transcriptional regulator [Planctomycetota bacterium]